MRIDRIEIHVKGKTLWAPSVEVQGRTLYRSGKWLKVAAIWDEDLVEGQTLAQPESFVSQLKATGLKADIFTFAQKLPETTPQYTHHFEWENLAVIPITKYSDWWDKRVEPSVRRAVRKAGKSELVVNSVDLDDDFVKGIASINDETPVRQGKPFWHFQKSLEAVRRENSTYPTRNIFLGAFHQGELVGFLRMIQTDSLASIIQILTKVKHFEKRPANALIAKAVEICEQKRFSHLVYCNYVYNDPKSSLTEFKRRNGFEQVLLPRYYVPLTFKGRIALSLGLHRGIVQCIPKPLLAQLLKMRSQWHARRLKAVESTL